MHDSQTTHAISLLDTTDSSLSMLRCLPRPKTEWNFKVTGQKVPHSLFATLAERYGFICQSPFVGEGRAAPNVRNVRLDDTLNCYYAFPDRPVDAVGAFRVVAPCDHPHPSHFGAPVPGTALWTVSSERMLKLMTAECWRGPGDGYRPAASNAFTGWPIVWIGEATRYQPSMFPNRTTLQRLSA